MLFMEKSLFIGSLGKSFSIHIIRSLYSSFAAYKRPLLLSQILPDFHLNTRCITFTSIKLLLFHGWLSHLLFKEIFEVYSTAHHHRKEGSNTARRKHPAFHTSCLMTMHNHQIHYVFMPSLIRLKIFLKRK